MNELLEKIRSRGYWKVVIHPGDYVENRVKKIDDLYPILQRTSARTRIWDFPHLDAYGEPRVDSGWIEQEYDRWGQPEIWRFRQDGQFVDFAGIHYDWYDWPGASYRAQGPSGQLKVWETLVRFTEIFQLAARLSRTDAGGFFMRIEASLNNLAERELCFENVIDGPFPVPQEFKATVESVPYSLDVSQLELITDTHKLALKPAAELFRRFGWEPPQRFLEDVQYRITHRTAR